MSQSTSPGPYEPGLPPPPGIQPDFVSPYSLWPFYAETGSLCIIVVTIFVAMRVYTKMFLLKSVTTEDVSCVVGWASFIVFIGMNIAIGQHGGGAHQWNVYFKDVQYQKRLTNYGDMVSISFLNDGAISSMNFS